MNKLKISNIIPVINEYRRAFIAKRYPEDNNLTRYQPQVRFEQLFNKSSSSNKVYLEDSWFILERPGQFSLQLAKVPNSEFVHEDLSMALECLLNFVRIQFSEDKLFDQI